MRPEEMQSRATASDYYQLIAVCDEYIEMANERARDNGYTDEEDEL